MNLLRDGVRARVIKMTPALKWGGNWAPGFNAIRAAIRLAEKFGMKWKFTAWPRSTPEQQIRTASEARSLKLLIVSQFLQFLDVCERQSGARKGIT
jgi:hypothetical protein